MIKKKKILFDITNSPHVLFFEPIINKLKNKYDILITTRNLAQTIPLLKEKGFKYTVIEGHSDNWLMKSLPLFIRSYKLYKFVKTIKPDICISHGSYFSSIAARFSGIKEIWTLDGDKAKIIIGTSMLFAKKVIIPECVPYKNYIKLGAKKKNLYHYPGLKEEFYLYNFKKNSKYLNQFKINKYKSIIFLRPEADFAEYYKGKTDIFLDLIPKLLKKYNIILMPRSKKQRELYSKFTKKGLIMPEVVDGPQMMANCDLIISGGGTMNREGVVLGKKVISTFQGELLTVDKYLINNKYMLLEKEITEKLIDDVINDKTKLKKYISSSKGLDYFVNFILKELELK
jgi:predicted glycosyltransferase